MAADLSATWDVRLKSWVASADGHPDFPIQNLPFGVFSPPGADPRGGVAIGNEILDLAAVLEAGLLAGDAAKAAAAAASPELNQFLALGAGPRAALRARLSELLSANGADDARRMQSAQRLLHRARDCALHLPARIGDYTDFYAGIHHAMNVGRLFRPANPLLPNYKYVPIGYHGRASSVRPSGTPFRRPNGQRKQASETVPTFGPCRNLDYELEIGIWIGPGNALGEPVPISGAAHHIGGFCLFNDWSARDLQAWEYQPLGPFLAKSFASTISPWIVTPEALQPFRIAVQPRPAGDPAPLGYLFDAADQQQGAFDIALEILLMTDGLRAKNLPPFPLGRSNTRHLYWTAAQLVSHHTSNGCNLNPGDLFGSGTISAPASDGLGSLLERTEGGKKPVTLPSGETRTFLDDGDEVIFRARASREGYATIGFGDCRARVSPS
ncbi:MAG: fumarylacetoacetase [Acetobacteraceae bacterium]